MNHRKWILTLVGVMLLVALLAVAGQPAIALSGITYTYTTNADFDDGTLINVNHDIADELTAE